MTIPRTLFQVIQSDPALGAVCTKVLIQNLQGNPLIDNSLEDTISIRVFVNTVKLPALVTKGREEVRQQKRCQSVAAEAMSLQYLPAPRQVATAVEVG